MKTLVRAVDLLEVDLTSRFRAKVGAAALDAVRDATPLAWLPLAMNVEFSERATEVLGSERAAGFFRNMVLREYKTSLFKAFIAGVTRAMNVTPAVFVKLAPKGWDLIYQDSGVLTPLEPENGKARLSITDLPPVCARNDVWLESVRNSFYTAFDLSNVHGDVEWEELTLSARRAVFRFVWEPRN
jgi:hypothetical protein